MRVTTVSQLAVWSSGMILASGARGPGFNSRNSPFDLPGAALLISQRRSRMRACAGERQSGCPDTLSKWAHGVVVSHPLRMRKALGSNPSGSISLR